MQMHSLFVGACGLTLSLMASAIAAQSLSQADIDQLGSRLTPVGAEKAADTAGTTNERTAALPTDAGQTIANNSLHNPTKNETPEFVITRQNYPPYRENLTHGQLALFEPY